MPTAGGVRVDPAHNDVLYVGAEFDGVFKSTDGAESWLPVSLGLDGLTIVGPRARSRRSERAVRGHLRVGLQDHDGSRVALDQAPKTGPFGGRSLDF